MLRLLLLAPSLKSIAKPDDDPGFPLWIVLIISAAAVLVVGGLILVLALKKSRRPEVPCVACGKILMPDWPQCMFCKTPRGAGGKASLEFVSGPMQGKTIDLATAVTTIGSAPGSTVTLTDNGVSRKHAGIRKADGGYELADLGSTNGVYVNGEKVAKKKLQLGDVIRIGTTEMIFKT